MASTPTQVTPLVWKDPRVSHSGGCWLGMLGRTLGCQRWENTISRGSVGASSAHFHCASPEGFSVCIRTGQTGRHWPWSLALQPVSPPNTASSDGCWTASSREPHRGVTEERVGGKKRMGEVDIFSSDEKLWLVSQTQEGLFKTSQPTSYFFSGLEGKILQRLPCFRTRLQGTALWL